VETKVYRGEWGITGDDWRSTRDKYYLEHYKQAWETRAFGDDPDLYVPVNAAVTPSLIDFYVYCWDETLTAVAAEGFRGFYYDQGYPRPVFDPELGLGYVRDDGRKCYATGLWLIRDLYKRLAYVNYLHKLPNFLADAQHYGHNMPCYGFLGIFAPCEGGYYGAVLDKVKSMDYYAALTPAKQFGQIPQIGLTPLRGADRVGFAWETRELVMMAMLHDHDLGSWGGRDMAAVNALRACRNRLLPWQPDVAFTGYWEAGGVVQTGHRQLLASVYTCPRGVLLVFGNVSKENIEATVTIDWQKLGIDRPQALIADAEDAGRRLNLSPEGKLTLFVPTRGLRLVAATPKPKARQ
jgi:hypothetical protein